MNSILAKMGPKTAIVSMILAFVSAAACASLSGSSDEIWKFCCGSCLLISAVIALLSILRIVDKTIAEKNKLRLKAREN
jgi:hypothetical protein